MFVVGLLAGVMSPSHAQESPGALVAATLVVHEPFGPWERGTWEWKLRRGAPVHARTRVVAGTRHEDSSLHLLERTAWEALEPSLAACRATDEEAPMPEDVAVPWTWLRVETRDGVWSRRLVPGEPEDASCIEALQLPVALAARSAPFPVPWWEGVETGRVRVESDLPAWVWMDGRPTWAVTPLLDWEVPVGERELRWITVGSGEERVARVRVESGRTTTIRMRFLAHDDEPTPSIPTDVPGGVGDAGRHGALAAVD